MCCDNLSFTQLTVCYPPFLTCLECSVLALPSPGATLFKLPAHLYNVHVLYVRVLCDAHTYIIFTNVTHSMTDGCLLKPTHPAMSLDSTFLYRAFKSSGPNGQLWAAFTEVQCTCTV